VDIYHFVLDGDSYQFTLYGYTQQLRLVEMEMAEVIHACKLDILRPSLVRSASVATAEAHWFLNSSLCINAFS